MAYITDAGGLLLANIVLGGSVAVPATWYFALYSGVQPNTVSTGSTIVEPTVTEYASYTRLAVTNNATNFVNGANNLRLSWPVSTGGVDVPFLCSGVGWCSASTAGTLVGWYPLPTAVSVTTGDQPFFNPSTLEFAFV